MSTLTVTETGLGSVTSHKVEALAPLVWRTSLISSFQDHIMEVTRIAIREFLRKVDITPARGERDVEL